MVYKKQFALAVRSQGKILREQDDKVFLPFGSNFELVLKNLNSVRAKVQVWIDGQLVTEGVSLVINPNESFNLERFIKNGNLSAGNKFKFIEKTTEIEHHRGNRIDDGVVRVEYKFEKIGTIPTPPTVIREHHRHYPVYQPTPAPYYTPRIYCAAPNEGFYGGVSGTSLYSKSLSRAMSSQPQAVACSHTSQVGITVPGEKSNQQFQQANWFLCENEVNSLCLQLVGMVENSVITQPIIVNTKPKCGTCGRKNKSTAKFCSNCGTSLVLI
jgi:hypothetical protein